MVVEEVAQHAPECIMRCGNGGLVVADGGGAYTTPPTQQNPSPFVSEWLNQVRLSICKTWASISGRGGGGAQGYP